MYQSLTALVEALLFAAGEPLTLAEISAAADLGIEDTRLALEELREQYEQEARGLKVRSVAGGYQLCTRPEYSPYIKRLVGDREDNRLSQPALETLAIVAYRQPITRHEIEAIRGVRVERVLTTLVEKGLIQEVGRKETPGRPILYGTTKEFLTAFGLQDLSHLPPLENKEEDPSGNRP